MSRKHRIAYVVSRFPKLSETFIVDEIVELRRLGLEIDLYSLLEGQESVAHPEARALAEDLNAANRESLRSLLGASGAWLLERPVVWLALFAEVFSETWRSPRTLARSIAALFAAGLFARRMRRDGVTHLHAHWATHPALMAWAIHRLTAIPYSFTIHADDLFVTQSLLETKLREAARIVTISRYNADFLEERYSDAIAGKLEIVHCGVRTDAFSPGIRPAPPTSGHRPLKILCVARLEPKKGHRDLVEACRKLAERGIELDCALLGDGALRETVEAQAAARLRGFESLARVRCLGAVAREQVLTSLREAGVFVLPSVIGTDGRRDGIPVALMEAMAMELPVVATRVSGVPELVEDGVHGRLVEPGDPNALADAIESISREPERARALGHAGRARVCAEFDVERNGIRMKAILTDDSSHDGSSVGVGAQRFGHSGQRDATEASKGSGRRGTAIGDDARTSFEVPPARRREMGER
jgi:glycosyltransferase involved in cell wall biosynthesis